MKKKMVDKLHHKTILPFPPLGKNMNIAQRSKGLELNFSLGGYMRGFEVPGEQIQCAWAWDVFKYMWMWGQDLGEARYHPHEGN